MDPSYNMEKSVSIWNCSGRYKVTTEDHMTLIRAFRPNFFESLCDSAPEAGNKLKRVQMLSLGEGGHAGSILC